MLSKAIQNALNEQINKELYSSYLYLGMSAQCIAMNLPGSARWLRMQSGEEYGHAMKLYDYIHQHGNRVELKDVEAPGKKFKSLKEIFVQVLEHEKKVTAMINKLYELAVKEKDYATQIKLQWFISEQVEEETNATEILQKLEMVGEEGPVLMMLDRDLGSRKAD